MFLVKFAYHTFELLHLSIFQRSRRDFPENFLHHVLAVIMISYSYCAAFLPVIQASMMLLDCTNIFVALFKMTIDVFDRDLIQGTCFFSMLGTWFYLRVALYPLFIYDLYKQSGETGHPV